MSRTLTKWSLSESRIVAWEIHPLFQDLPSSPPELQQTLCLIVIHPFTFFKNMGEICVHVEDMQHFISLTFFIQLVKAFSFSSVHGYFMTICPYSNWIWIHLIWKPNSLSHRSCVLYFFYMSLSQLDRNLHFGLWEEAGLRLTDLMLMMTVLWSIAKLT